MTVVGINLTTYRKDRRRSSKFKTIKERYRKGRYRKDVDPRDRLPRKRSLNEKILSYMFELFFPLFFSREHRHFCGRAIDYGILCTCATANVYATLIVEFITLALVSNGQALASTSPGT